MPTLDWIGKKAVVNHHRDVPYRLLHCDKSKSVGDPDAGNLLVQGDNLEALKALLPYYAGKVKCIYIDPPYNTGNEGWVYNDNVNSPEIREWLGQVVGKEAEDLSRHDKWLCMMYPRLRIIREFLRDDGVMLISINDETRALLELLLDEIFPRQRIGSFVWRTKDTSNDADRNYSSIHEHILIYANPNFSFFGGVLDDKKYKNPDNDERGPYSLDPITKAHSAKERANTFYPIQDTKTGWWYPCSPDRVWAYASKSRQQKKQKLRAAFIEDMIEDNRIIFSASEAVTYNSLDEILYAIRSGRGPVDGNGRQLLREDFPDLDFWVGKPIGLGRPSKKSFWNEKKSLIKPVSSYIPKTLEKDSGTFDNMNTEKQGAATGEIQDIFGYRAFDYPKPLTLIGSLIKATTSGDDIILDSFAGSGTTGHAVLLINSQDDEMRKFILVEMLPEIGENVTAKRLEIVISGYAKGGNPDKFIDGLGSGFRFCAIGEPLFDADGNVSPAVTYADLAAHVFFCETGSPIPRRADGTTPLIGAFQGRAIYLLHAADSIGVANPNAGNVLTASVLEALPLPEDGFTGARIVYGEGCTVPDDRLNALGVTFKQIPYQIEGL